MIPFWEKLGLDPYSAKKQIKYFVVYPNNSDIESSVRRFFKSLGNAYEACHLGKHEPGYAGAYLDGLVPVSVTSKHMYSLLWLSDKLIYMLRRFKSQ